MARHIRIPRFLIATAAVVLLAVLSDLPFNYVIVVVVDAAGAIWTAKALRREGHAAVTI